MKPMTLLAKYRVAIVLLVTLVAITASCSKSSVKTEDIQEWKTLISAEGHFEVSTPGELQPVSQSVNTQSRRLVMHAFTLNTPREFYTVTYIDYPLVTSDPAMIERGFDGGRDRTLTNGGKLVGERSISLDGIPGRELIVQDSNGLQKTRMYYLKGRLYQVSLAIKKATQDAEGMNRLTDATATRFFDSFKVNRS
jgi:hypothetical protein